MTYQGESRPHDPGYMRRARLSVWIAILFILSGLVVFHARSHAAGPLAVYGCVRADDDNLGGYTEVCRV